MEIGAQQLGYKVAGHKLAGDRLASEEWEAYMSSSGEIKMSLSEIT